MFFRLKFLTPLTFFLAMLYGCGTKNAELPAKMPSDFKLHYHVDGGMSDYTLDFSLESDTLQFYRRENGKLEEKKTSVPQSESAHLFEMLKRNQFDKINYRIADGVVHDRGGVTVTASWSKQKIVVSDAQNNFVEEEWFERWKLLTDSLERFAFSKVAKSY